MSYLFNESHLLEKHMEVFPVIGRNPNLGTTVEDIWSLGGIYAWPELADYLVAVSDSADDAVGGSGACCIEVDGIYDDWTRGIVEIPMAGLSNSAPTSRKFIRVNKVIVKQAGAYCRTNQGSNAGNITVSFAGGGAQAEIRKEGVVAFGRSQLGRFSVPDNKVAYLRFVHYHLDSTKSASFELWKREGADIVTAPYTSKEPIRILDAISGDDTIDLKGWYYLPGKTDVWISAALDSGSGGLFDVDYEVRMHDV